MANSITQTVTRTALQTSGTLTGNGSTADVTGAQAVIIGITKSTGTAGVYTFERSPDEGQNWSTLSVTRLSTGASVTATTAGESGETFVASLVDGDQLVRARISTAWVTTAPAVTLAVLS